MIPRALVGVAVGVAVGALVTSWLSRSLASVPDLDYRQSATLLGASAALNLALDAALGD